MNTAVERVGTSSWSNTKPQVEAVLPCCGAGAASLFLQNVKPMARLRGVGVDPLVEGGGLCCTIPGAVNGLLPAAR